MSNELLARHMQAILNTTVEGIFGLDERGLATFLNRSAASMFGTTVASLLGHPLHEIIHADEQGVTSFARCPVCCPPRSSANSGIAHFRTLDGAAFPIEYTTSSMCDAGQARGTVVTFRDITERLAVERLKDEFISTVSHELRTPLTSIRGALGLLGRGTRPDADPRTERMLDIATANTERLVRLIDDILDIEKIHSGRVELHRSPVSAASLLHEAAAAVHAGAERAGVSIVCDDIEATLLVDRNRMIQALTNLLGNAVKFSFAGTVVRTGGTVEGDTIAFFVSDEGRGIPPEKLEAIFERFRQVNASDSRDQGGTGLGLAIARSLVQAHGGRIWAENREPCGSTFRFTLPCVIDATDDVYTIEQRRPSVPRKVLIVDDDHDIREITAASLEVTRGWDIVSAACGSDAIKEASAARPDAILLDVMMPDMDGPTAFRILRSNPETESIPVILLTAKIQSTDYQRYIRLGVEGVIAKPFDPFTLADRVAETLRWE